MSNKRNMYTSNLTCGKKWPKDSSSYSICFGYFFLLFTHSLCHSLLLSLSFAGWVWFEADRDKMWERERTEAESICALLDAARWMCIFLSEGRMYARTSIYVCMLHMIFQSWMHKFITIFTTSACIPFQNAVI